MTKAKFPIQNQCLFFILVESTIYKPEIGTPHFYPISSFRIYNQRNAFHMIKENLNPKATKKGHNNLNYYTRRLQLEFEQNLSQLLSTKKRKKLLPRWSICFGRHTKCRNVSPRPRWRKNTLMNIRTLDWIRNTTNVWFRELATLLTSYKVGFT